MTSEPAALVSSIDAPDTRNNHACTHHQLCTEISAFDTALQVTVIRASNAIYRCIQSLAPGTGCLTKHEENKRVRAGS